MERGPRALLPVAIGLALLVGACASAAPGQPSAAGDPSHSASVDPSFEALVAEAIEVRSSLGLRADEWWVREVSADPGARTSFGIPLTLAEEADLNARAAAVAELGPVLQEYGAQHPAEYAGLFVDQDRGGLLVVLFTDRVEEHGAAIAKLVRPGASIEIRAAPTAETDLLALMDRISTDEQLLRGVGVVVVTASLNEETGTIEVEVSTERGDAPALLVGRYGPTVVASVLDPTGAFLKPRGAIVGRVVDARSDGVRATVGSVPLFAELPLDSVGPPETDADGSFQLDDMLPGRWRLTAEGEGLGPTSLEVDVPPGGTATVEIVLD